jgi:hypothetical protein
LVERIELVTNRHREARTLADWQVRKAAIDGERKRVEAEVGPVRYLTQLLGGVDVDLEKAGAASRLLRPLAVLLLIAATR